MFVIFNSINKEPNTITTIFIDTNIILLVMYPFLVEKDAKFKVL